MDQVDISIIIPTFNRLWSLPEAIASCRDAHLTVEIIVIDDGSADGTWEWLQSQLNVFAIRQENLGKDWAVNRAFSVARGEYIRFLDDDDKLVPGSSQNLIAAARRERADVVAAGYIMRDEETGIEQTEEWFPNDDFIAQQLGESYFSHYSAFIFRKEFIADIPHRQEFGALDDRMFMIEVALKGPRLTFIDKPTLIHRHHSNGRLQFQPGLAQAVKDYAHWKIYRRAASVLEARDDLTIRRRAAICRTMWRLAHRMCYHHRPDGNVLAKWVYSLDPDFQPPESGMLGWMYRKLGFRYTERVLALRRTIWTKPMSFLNNLLAKKKEAAIAGVTVSS